MKDGLEVEGERVKVEQESAGRKCCVQAERAVIIYGTHAMDARLRFVQKSGV